MDRLHEEARREADEALRAVTPERNSVGDAVTDEDALRPADGSATWRRRTSTARRRQRQDVEEGDHGVCVGPAGSSERAARSDGDPRELIPGAGPCRRSSSVGVVARAVGGSPVPRFGTGDDVGYGSGRTILRT